MRNSIRISVVVPVYNAVETLQSCLQALLDDTCNGTEIIVVDDHSTDGSAAVAREMGVQVVEMDRRRGPAAARNTGVEHGKGKIIFFVDADVVIKPTTISRVLEIFEENPGLAAVFGSYDNEPASPNFLSQYKNLLHHYVHQNSKEEAITFWAGCGAIRKDIFRALGAFNEQAYQYASIEDIELGLRLWRNHYPVRLDKGLQVKHLKRWTTLNLLKADIFYRAYPWSKLILESKIPANDLNLQASHRLSSIFVGILVLLTLLWALARRWIPSPIGMLIGILLLMILATLLILNRHLYQFFFRRHGVYFTLMAILWHLFYYFYSGATFVLCWFQYKLKAFLSFAPKRQWK